MTLPSKGLRKISVDGKDFKYIVSKIKYVGGQYYTKDCNVLCNNPAYIIISVQSAKDPKSIFSYKYVFETFKECQNLPSATPSIIADIIRGATNTIGWNPHSLGNIFEESHSSNGQLSNNASNLVNKYNETIY